MRKLSDLTFKCTLSSTDTFPLRERSSINFQNNNSKLSFILSPSGEMSEGQRGVNYHLFIKEEFNPLASITNYGTLMAFD